MPSSGEISAKSMTRFILIGEVISRRPQHSALAADVAGGLVGDKCIRAAPTDYLSNRPPRGALPPHAVVDPGS